MKENRTMEGRMGEGTGRPAGGDRPAKPNTGGIGASGTGSSSAGTPGAGAIGAGSGNQGSTPGEDRSRVGHLVDEVKEKGAHMLGSMKDKVAHGAENLKGKSFDEISGDVKDYVTSHPGRVVLASFVIGLIFGSMVRSGRHRG
jgi:hypothetical protein